MVNKKTINEKGFLKGQTCYSIKEIISLTTTLNADKSKQMNSIRNVVIYQFV